MSLDSVLLIDDDEITNRLHKNLIENHKITHSIYTKKNGREALEFIKQRYYGSLSLPSLIILDLNMPVMDGIDFLKAIDESNLLYVNRIPIAILSNSSHPQDVQKVKELRECFYVIKPLTKEKLDQILEQSLAY